jgi:citrate synthase
MTVSGIGHKIKSVNNPDLRVELVKEYVRKNFPSHSLLDYALAVEKVTTSKKDTVSTFLMLSQTDTDLLFHSSSLTSTVALPSASSTSFATLVPSRLKKQMSTSRLAR